MSIATGTEPGNELSTIENGSLRHIRVSSSVSPSQGTAAETLGDERRCTENCSAHAAHKRLVLGQSGSLYLVRNYPIPKTPLKLSALRQFPIGA